MEIYAFEFPGRKLKFEAASDLAFDGLDLLTAGFIMPWSVDVTFSAFDAADGYALNAPEPARPYWLVQTVSAPDSVQIRPAWQNEASATLPTIDGKTLQHWVASTRETPSMDWRELLFRAVSVRLPGNDAAVDDALQIRSGPDLVDYPIARRDHARFVDGPLRRKSVPAPLTLSVTNQLRIATLEIHVNWSLWTDPRLAGFHDLKAAVDRLRSARWNCVHSEIDAVKTSSDAAP